MVDSIRPDTISYLDETVAYSGLGFLGMDGDRTLNISLNIHQDQRLHGHSGRVSNVINN
jgi:hypothetical protein